MTDERAIKAPLAPGLSVIEASAGTGKTWTIAHLVSLWLVRGTVERLDQMVLVTFTEAAAAELAERVRETLAALVGLALSGGEAPEDEPGLKELLGEISRHPERSQENKKKSPRQEALNRLQGALEEADRLLVCTIHSFCRRVLSDESFLCALPAGFEVLQDPGPLMERGVRDVWRSNVEGDPLVALVAAHRHWKLDEDLGLVRAASGKSGLRCEPDLDFDEVRARLAGHLISVRGQRNEFQRAVDLMRSLESEGAGRNKAGVALDSAGDWAAALERLDPGRPEPGIFALLEGLQKLPKWLSQSKGPAALKAKVKQACMDFEGLGLLAAAAGALDSARHLRWAWLNAARKACGAALERELRRGNKVTYDGLVQHLRRALVAGDAGLRADLLKRLRSRWKLALVDESQDTDPAQLEIFRAIFDNGDGRDGHQLILVGDPKQAIYGFRGADLEAYLKARAGAQERLSLVDTYRSAPGLVAAQNALWKLAAPALGHGGLGVAPAKAARSEGELRLPGATGRGPHMVVALVPEAERELWGPASRRRRLAAAATASAVVDVLGLPMGGTRVHPGHCAVLCASHQDARLAQAALAQRGVSAVLLKAGNVFLTEECGDLRLLLKALHKPGDPRLRRAALATRMIGLDAGELARMDDELDEAWQRRFADWKEAWTRGGLAALFQALDQDPEALCFLKLARLPAGERRITDLKHLLELAQAEEAQKRAGPEAVLEWLESSMQAADDKSAPEAHLRRLEKDGSAVQILTMHGAKGLEFDLVFCPDLWESRWEGMARRFNYDLARDGQDGWVLFDRKNLEPARVEALDSGARLAELQEDLRLAYVALTRAKRRVWFLAGWIGYGGGKAATLPSALDWLLRDTGRADAADAPAWMRRMLAQKKDGPVCEHEAALRRLAEEVPGLVEIAEVDIHERATAVESGAPSVPLPASRQKEGFGEWRRISYTSLTRGLGEDEDAWKSEEASDSSGTRFEPEAPLALASMPGGKNTGSCLHWILEHWDFRSDPSDLVRRGLGRFGLDLPQRLDKEGRSVPAVEELLVQVLPRLAKARLPVLDVALSDAAGEAAFSELRFLLPLGARGLGGEALAAVFEEHGDAPLKAYGASLRALPTEAFHGMLEGSIDRMVRVGGRWAVLDWKSNRPGDLASDFGRETLWRLAAEEHYILQLCLYMVVARRFLARRGQGEELVCGGLAFLRGMDEGLERGLLMLEPAPALLDALDTFFEAGRAL